MCERLHRLIAVLRLFTERLETNRFQLSGDTRHKFRERGRRGDEDLSPDMIERAFERRPTGEHFVKNHTETIDIAWRSNIFGCRANLFRRHVGWGADQGAGSGQ